MLIASSTTRLVIRPGRGTHFVNAYLWKPVHSMTCGASPAEVANEILGP
jgi:hypothetical protein